MISKKTILKRALKLGEDCNRCGHCCKHGSGALVGDDLKNIAKFLGISEKKLKETYLEEIEKFNTKRLRPKIIKKDKPYGICIFYKKCCSIHPVKPLECKIGNCSPYGEQLSLWFTLNYFVNKKDPESIRQFAVYLKSGGKTLDKGKLEDFIPDKKELKKILNFDKLR